MCFVARRSQNRISQLVVLSVSTTRHAKRLRDGSGGVLVTRCCEQNPLRRLRALLRSVPPPHHPCRLCPARLEPRGSLRSRLRVRPRSCGGRLGLSTGVGKTAVSRVRVTRVRVRFWIFQPVAIPSPVPAVSRYWRYNRRPFQSGFGEVVFSFLHSSSVLTNIFFFSCTTTRPPQIPPTPATSTSTSSRKREMTPPLPSPPPPPPAPPPPSRKRETEVTWPHRQRPPPPFHLRRLLHHHHLHHLPHPTANGRRCLLHHHHLRHLPRANASRR